MSTKTIQSDKVLKSNGVEQRPNYREPVITRQVSVLEVKQNLSAKRES